MSHERVESVTETEAVRAELYDTLAHLRDRLNYARRFDDAVARAKARLATQQRENPLAFAVGVAGASAIAGLAVWKISVAVARKFAE